MAIHFCSKSVCFKIENEMERKFYEQLDPKIENKRKNSFLNGEKYKSLIQELSQLKQRERNKEPSDYQLLKFYDVVQIGNTVKLIYPALKKILQ